MAKGSVAFVLVEVDAEGNETPVSEHAAFLEGWNAGTSAVHAVGNERKAFSLYVAGRGRRVARFAHNRIAPTYNAADVAGAMAALS